MKIRFWVIWAAGSLVLCFLPYPLDAIGKLSLFVLVVCVLWAVVDTQVKRYHRPRHLIFRALDENEPIHLLDVMRHSGLSARVANDILDDWVSRNLVWENRGKYNLNGAGKKKLGQEFGKPYHSRILRNE